MYLSRYILEIESCSLGTHTCKSVDTTPFLHAHTTHDVYINKLVSSTKAVFSSKFSNSSVTQIIDYTTTDMNNKIAVSI